MTPSTIFQAVNNAQLPTQYGDEMVVNEQVQFSGGDALIGFSASAWSSVGGQLLTYELWLDGQPTGGQLAMYANYESVHLALGHTWVYVPGLTAGAHEVSLLAGPNTVTDGNDTASITVWELGDGCAVSFAGDAAPPASGDGQMFFKGRLDGIEDRDTA